MAEIGVASTPKAGRKIGQTSNRMIAAKQRHDLVEKFIIDNIDEGTDVTIDMKTLPLKFPDYSKGLN